MSRRAPNPAADRAAQNQQTLKTLVKVESNKTCADCKKNKHPRWASWNLGVFLCIRCSGIHRGMGTHISRVKSVDLDAWTDEQLQSMLRWGNARANKYWESKLAPGHIPSEAKIENFIRTKYDSKRWVMDGGMPDPATLDAPGDDEVPLNVVQEKAKLDRASSTRGASASIQPAPLSKPSAPPIDLFGDVPSASSTPTAGRSTSAAPSLGRPAASSSPKPAPQKSTKPGDSLLGFDFFGSTTQDVPGRPSSATPSGTPSNVPSRPDLKQSILSLYASAPRTNSQPQQSHSRSGSAFQSSNAPAQSPPVHSSNSGLADAFGGLTFSPSTQSPPLSSSKPSPFASLSSPTSQRPASGIPSMQFSKPSNTGGNFFNSSTPNSSTFSPLAPAPQTTTAKSRPARGLSNSSGFGDFTDAASSISPAPPKQSSTSGLEDIWGMSSPPSQPTANPLPIRDPPPIQNPTSSTFNNFDSPFNLSSPKKADPPKMSPQSPISKSSAPNTSNIMNANPWGADNAWASSASPAPTTVSQSKSTPAAPSMSEGWGWATQGNGLSSTATAPKVAPDEDFGGWETGPSPVTAQPSASSIPQNTAPKPAGNAFGAGEDLFSNVWE